MFQIKARNTNRVSPNTRLAPIGRRGFGELIFFVFWTTALVVPIVMSKRPSNFYINMVDYTGFVRPFVAGSPSGNNDVSIGGGGEIMPGRVAFLRLKQRIERSHRIA